MKKLIPDTIATRTLLVLIVGLTVSHLLGMALYFTDRVNALRYTGGEHIGERIVTIDRLIRNSSPEERNRIARLADGPKLHVTLSRVSAIDDAGTTNWQAGVLRDALRSHLSDGVHDGFRLRYGHEPNAAPWQAHLREAHPREPWQETLMVSFLLPDGEWLNFAAPVEEPPTLWSMRFVLSMAVMLLTTGVLAAIVVYHVSRPLASFTAAVQRLGVDVKAPPMAEKGPQDVRQLAHAFNSMQNRIRRFVEDRTQMIAAISHDLGTPITRLRLRAEFVEDDEQRKKMLADLNDMERMVSSALSFSRDEARNEPRAMVDLRSLLQRIHDDSVDAGFAVSLEMGSEPIPYWCRPAALRRALSNLVENAVIYGNRATITVDRRPGSIFVCIEDEGPGIPEELHEEMFRPFRRLEGSRSRETGGTGLGLTISRTIIRGHGGDVILRNRSEGGLRVEVSLPC